MSRPPFCSTCEQPALVEEGFGVLHLDADGRKVYPLDDTTGHDADLRRWHAGELLTGDRVRNHGQQYQRARENGTAIITGAVHIGLGHLEYDVAFDEPYYPGGPMTGRWSAENTRYVASAS
jgi:hypothetical protein